MAHSGGPLPKRSAARRRRNAVPGETVVTRNEIVRPPTISKAERNALHPVALKWWDSLKKSGQSEFFEPSDWAAARYVMEAMSKNLRQGERFSAVLFSSTWAAMEALLTTEASRRRARLEVERGLKEPEDGPTALDEYKARLAK